MEDRPESPPTQTSERRKEVRHVADEAASLLLVNQGSTLPCRLIELSLGGCRLRMAERFPAGMKVRIEVVFKVLGIAFRLPGVTEWTNGKDVVGIRFVGVTSRRRAELAELLADFETENAAKAMGANRGAEQAAEERQPLSKKSEKHPSGAKARDDIAGLMRGPKCVPSTELSSSATTTTPAVKRERRAQPRQRVDTSAVIRLIDLAANVHGRILNLSLGGCHIRTDERFPVGIFRRVETEFRLEGLPFRLAGVTQSIFDRKNVGIRFLDMSDRKREQLVQLIEEIEELHEREKAEAALDAPSSLGGTEVSAETQRE